MKSKGTAYLLWAVGLLGILGLHRFYLGKIGTGIIWILTVGVGGVGAVIDLFTLGGQVEAYNTRQELDQLRGTTLASAQMQQAQMQQQVQAQQQAQQQAQPPSPPATPQG